MNFHWPIFSRSNQYSDKYFYQQQVHSKQLMPKAKESKLIYITFLLFLYALPVFSAIEIDYRYDDLNRLKTVVRKDGPVQQYHYDEVGNLTQQSISNSPDTDGDQIANFIDTDDDNDKITDVWELQYNLDPLDPTDAEKDLDGDGLTNLAEFQNGTDPEQNNFIPLIPILQLLLD